MANQTGTGQMNEYVINNDAIAKAVSSLTKALEPRINEFATFAANRAVHEGQRIARSVYNKVREKPWYLIGAAATLLLVAAVFFRTGDHELDENEGPMRQLH